MFLSRAVCAPGAPLASAYVPALFAAAEAAEGHRRESSFASLNVKVVPGSTFLLFSEQYSEYRRALASSTTVLVLSDTSSSDCTVVLYCTVQSCFSPLLAS